MTKQEFLSASLPYGLKHQLTEKGMFNLDEEYPRSHNNCMTIIGTSGNEYDLSDDNWGVGYIEIDEFKPIIRHIDTLTKECVQADYNDGKPFIPIVELAKMAFPKIKKFNVKGNYVDLGHGYTFHYIKDSFDCKAGYNDQTWDYHCHVLNQLQLFQQLLRWHFWPNMPEGEQVVYVTEDFNPYK